MKICQFCGAQYTPRPQVKNPRACSNPSCQRARQKANENDWHSRNQGLYDANYHNVKRKVRIAWIRDFLRDLMGSLARGLLLNGQKVEEWASFVELFEGFFLGLGIKRLNKFWKPC